MLPLAGATRVQPDGAVAPQCAVEPAVNLIRACVVLVWVKLAVPTLPVGRAGNAGRRFVPIPVTYVVPVPGQVIVFQAVPCGAVLVITVADVRAQPLFDSVVGSGFAQFPCASVIVIALLGTVTSTVKINIVETPPREMVTAWFGWSRLASRFVENVTTLSLTEDGCF